MIEFTREYVADELSKVDVQGYSISVKEKSGKTRRALIEIDSGGEETFSRICSALGVHRKRQSETVKFQFNKFVDVLIR